MKKMISLMLAMALSCGMLTSCSVPIYIDSTNKTSIDVDSDFDGLSDDDEINIYGTDPKKWDTDGDGASDGWEVANGFDPLKKDMNFLANAESLEVSQYNPVAASVSVQLAGSQVESLRVEAVNAGVDPFISHAIPGYLGDAYNFEVQGGFDKAELSFVYDESLGEISAGFQPRIYFVNEADGTLEELPNQTIDNGKIMATVSHFSTYILLNKVEFDKVWETEIRPPVNTEDKSTPASLDVVLVVDGSGSMTQNDPQNLRFDAAKKFIDKLRNSDRAAVIGFDGSAYRKQDFTNDTSLLYSAIVSTYTGGGTNLTSGIRSALDLFDQSSNASNTQKYIIMLTDGDGTYDTSCTKRAADSKIVIYTIGLGRGVKEPVLRGIADGTGGKYYFATDANELVGIFEETINETIDYTTDSNGDGISDYYTKLICEGKLTLGNGVNPFLGISYEEIQKNSDFDGDGLKNGEELIITVQESDNKNRVFLKMISDPTLIHSDGDGIDDLTEVETQRNPLKPEYQKNAVELITKTYDFDVAKDLDGNWAVWLNGMIYGVRDYEKVYLECLIDYINNYGDMGVAENGKLATQFIDFSDWVLANIDDRYVPEVAAAIRECKNMTNAAGANVGNAEINIWRSFLEDAQFGVNMGDGMENIVSILADTKTFSPNSVYPARMATLKLSNTGTAALAYVGVGLEILSAGTDAWDTFSNLSKIEASLDVFKANSDILLEIRKSSKNQNARNAAQTVLNKMSDKASSILENTDEILRSLVLNNGITIAADTSLSVFAGPLGTLVTIEKALFDLAFEISDLVKAACQCTFYAEIYTATTTLIDNEVYVEKGGFGIDYYFIKDEESGTFERLLAHAANIDIVYQSSLYEYNIRQPFSDNHEAERMRDNAIARIIQQMENLKIGFKS